MMIMVRRCFLVWLRNDGLDDVLGRIYVMAWMLLDGLE